MAIFKCKMCGGDLEVNENITVGTCNYCGSTMTLPRLDDDKKANLYDRANHFRRNNDFDKAMSIYESILNEDKNDAEAYWSLVLCKYGIEYVEEPGTHKRVITCNRTQYTSVFTDEDYKMAIALADVNSRMIYEAESKAIEEIQRGILDISTKEEPFDIFICYKDTDNNGRRTQDSVLAQDIYYQLTQEGYKVFFSRITLEDKLGTAYEPYIFAALNSSKVMVVVGTKHEYFNAVWVKNEWSRYLALIKNGAKKVLIPSFKDIDPYDLPDEFSHLQALDMSKLGYSQDLIRGIKKILEIDSQKESKMENMVVQGNVNTDALLERAFLCIEDSEFDKADELLEQVLNMNPRNAKAYLGKLMVELEITQEENLADDESPLEEFNNYQKIIRFGDEIIVKRLQEYNKISMDKKEIEIKENKYQEVLVKIRNCNCEIAYKNVLKKLEFFNGYKDTDELILKCNSLAEEAKVREEEVKLINEKCAKDANIRANIYAEEAKRIEEQYIGNKSDHEEKKNKLIIMIVMIIICIIIYVFIKN